MKRILLLGSILGWTLQVSGQEVTPLLIPLLENQKLTPIEIEADCIRDTIKAYYMAAVLFGDDARIDEASVVRSQSI